MVLKWGQHLMDAARNYPQIAGSMQVTFVRSWNRMLADLGTGKIKPARFNRIKSKYLEPMVKKILQWEPELIDPYWLGTVARGGLIKDEDIEKRFPKFVLAFLDRRDRASQVAATEKGLESTVSSLTENFAVVWALSSIHVPTLYKWVDKYEQ